MSTNYIPDYETIQLMIHSLKTPLAVVTMYLENLDELGELNAIQEKWIDKALIQCDTMLDTIGDILTRIHAEGDALKLEWTDLRELVHEVVESRSEFARMDGITIQHAIDDDIPSILCDRLKIVHVLDTLVDNAIRYNFENGTIWIELFVIDGFIQIDVRDNGIGIAQKYHELIFYQHYRVDDETKPEGSGIGLPIARSIVEKHGGRMWLKSKWRQGSTFSFSLPLSVADFNGGHRAEERSDDVDDNLQERSDNVGAEQNPVD